jgi:hypothetical protein
MMLVYLKNTLVLLTQTINNECLTDMKFDLRSIFIFLFLFPALTSAATLTNVNVEKQGKQYTLHIKALVNADINKVKQIITDYNNLTSINPYLIESKLISRTEDEKTTVSTLSEACILFICYKIRHVQIFQQLKNDILYGRTIPKMSDFKQGWTRWTIKEDKSNPNKKVTQLTLDTKMTPDFFILPIIGTYQVKKKMLEIATVTIHNLEKEAQKNIN